MNIAQSLKTQELDLMQTHREGLFPDDESLKKAVEDLLDGIGNNADKIRTSKDWDWASRAIVCWESFLRSRFGTSKGVRILSLIDQRESLEDVVQQEEVQKDQPEDLVAFRKTLEEMLVKQQTQMKVEMWQIFEQHEQRSSTEHVGQVAALAAISTGRIMKYLPQSTLDLLQGPILKKR